VVKKYTFQCDVVWNEENSKYNDAVEMSESIIIIIIVIIMICGCLTLQVEAKNALLSALTL